MVSLSSVNPYLIILYHLIIATQGYDTSTLKLVHVLFRHGNRTASATYPTDPYKNETYYPFGRGQLTNKGRIQAYKIGKSLRTRYQLFLGNLYTPDVLEAVSTGLPRSEMSLELVLAGLYPPRKTELNWNLVLNWQPIPYDETNATHMIPVPIRYCPNYIREYRELINSVTGKELLRPYQKLFDYVNKHSGLNVTENAQLIDLYNTFSAQGDWGFNLPLWVKKIYPDILNKAAGDGYLHLTYTPTLRRLSGGYLLKKIVDDCKAKSVDTLIPRDRKLFLYSAHDLNIGHLLGAMQLMDAHQPPYGSYVLLEVHEINGVHGFKIFYQNYTSCKPLLLTLPGCADFCPIDNFTFILRDVLDVDNNSCGLQ